MLYLTALETYLVTTEFELLEHKIKALLLKNMVSSKGSLVNKYYAHYGNVINQEPRIIKSDDAIPENDTIMSENDDAMPKNDSKISGNDTIVLDDTVMSENDMTEHDTSNFKFPIDALMTENDDAMPESDTIDSDNDTTMTEHDTSNFKFPVDALTTENDDAMPENNDAIPENDLDDTITSENFKFPIDALISENDDATSESDDETVPEKDTKVSGNGTIVLDDTLMSENDTSMTENDTNDIPISIHPKRTLQNCSTPKAKIKKIIDIHSATPIARMDICKSINNPESFIEFNGSINISEMKIENVSQDQNNFDEILKKGDETSNKMAATEIEKTVVDKPNEVHESSNSLKVS